MTAKSTAKKKENTRKKEKTTQNEEKDECQTNFLHINGNFNIIFIFFCC